MGMATPCAMRHSVVRRRRPERLTRPFGIVQDKRFRPICRAQRRHVLAAHPAYFQGLVRLKSEMFEHQPSLPANQPQDVAANYLADCVVLQTALHQSGREDRPIHQFHGFQMFRFFILITAAGLEAGFERRRRAALEEL